MPAPQDLIESLLAHCIEAGESGYRPALEEMCLAHPTAAGELRDRVAHLERLGFLGSPAPSSAKPWLPDQVGGYRLAGLLGRGGMGVVFRGQKNGGDEVAIKIVRPDLLADEQARARFRREALMVSRLQHPGICPVLEVGVDEDLPFVVMPLLRGRTFGAWLREQHPPRQTILDILAGHARALHAAHEAGIVHRDVTPGNLFVTDDGQPMVLDFGLARDTTGELPTLTGSQDLVGTLPYMAPEQIRGASIDRRTDVYALGVVAYEALSGRLPFVAKSRSEVSRLILSGDAPRLTRLVKGFPRGLERVVQSAMDPEPPRRHASALELAEDLQRVRQGQAPHAHGVGAVLRARRWSMHHPVASTAILLLGLLLGVATGFVLERSSQARVHYAAERTLESRALEQADPMRALDAAIEAHAEDPGARSLGQLNHVLQNVSLLSTAAVAPGEVRGIGCRRLDDERDRVAVISDGGLVLLTLRRTDGSLQLDRHIPLPPKDLLSRLSIAPNSRYIACGGTGKVVHLIDAATGVVRRRLPSADPATGMKGEVAALKVTDTGEVWAADGVRQVWHWPASEEAELVGRSVFDLQDPRRPEDEHFKEPIHGLLLDSTGDMLLVTVAWAWRLRPDGSVVWRWPPTGAWTDPYPRLSGTMRHLARLSEARDEVMLCQCGEVRLLRWSDGSEVWSAPSVPQAIDGAVASDGTIATLHEEGVVRFWRRGDTPIATYRDADDQIADVRVSPERPGFLLIGRNGSRTRVDEAGRAMRTLRGGDPGRWVPPGPFNESSDGAVLLAAAGSGRVRAWDLDGSHALPQQRLVESPPLAMALHPDGRRLLIVTENRRVWCWDPVDRGLSAVGEVPFAPRARSQGKAGERPVFAGFRRRGRSQQRVDRLSVFDADGRPLRTPVQFAEQGSLVGVAWLPNERVVVAIGEARFMPGRLCILDASGTNEPFKQALICDRVLEPEVGRPECLDASDDGQTIAFGCTTSGLRVWRQSTDTKLVPWRSASTQGRRVWSIDLSGDGTRLAATCEDGSVLVWDLADREPWQLVKPRDRPSRCVFGAGDRLLVEFAHDGLVRVWEPGRRACLLEVKVGAGAVVTDAVLLGGSGATTKPLADLLPELSLATISSDGWVCVWSFDAAGLLTRARGRLAALQGH